MSEQVELKACMCEGKAEIQYYSFERWAAVVCTECGINSIGTTIEQLAPLTKSQRDKIELYLTKRWNRRPLEAALQAKLDKALIALKRTEQTIRNLGNGFLAVEVRQLALNEAENLRSDIAELEVDS